MTTARDIYNYIDTFAPFEQAESYDNVGILVGSESRAVRRVLAALDITADVVEEAVKIGADTIISHHPVIFTPMKRVLDGSVVCLLIRSGITAICAHTNLDKSPVFGVNTELAKAMELENIRVSENNDILFLGDIKESFTADQFAELIKRKLSCESFPYTSVNNNIKKVGLCSGAGGSEIFSAIGEGCDAFVTGELKHHELIAANESGISVFVPGHYKTEDIVIQPLCDKLSEHFREIEFVKSKSFNDKMIFI